MERYNNDNPSTNDPSISGDDNSNSTSSDDESNQETSMNTTTVENRSFMVPNSTLFSVDIMITKTEIYIHIYLRSARQKKLTLKNGHGLKRKKGKFKFNNDCNNIIARSIWFTNEYIINGALQVKDAHLANAQLS